MKHNKLHIILPLSAALALGGACGLGSCGGSSKSNNEASAHEKWLQSLNDSIDALRLQVDSVNNELETLRTEVGSLLESFERVDDPRQVEGFTIYKGWARRYPLTQTGVAARMTENEDLEIVAALSGGTFDRLRAIGSGGSAQTARVPHDQALNYRAGGLNTVAFSGAAADSVGAIIAASSSPVEIQFMGGSGGKHRLSAAEQEMIAATWRLTDARKRTSHLERLLPLLRERIKIYEQRAAPRDSAAN